MARILAAVDATAATCPVLQEAQLLGEVFGATPDAVYVGRRGRGAAGLAAHAGMGVRVLHGRAEAAILREASAEDVVLSVVGAHRLVGGRFPIGHVTRRLIQHLPKMAVVVPPDYVPTKLARVLFPLDGTWETGRAVAGLVDVFIRHGAELVAMHAFTVDTMPAMLDHAGALQLWEEEFVRRACPELLGARVELCVGAPAAKVAEIARREPTDLVVLAWHRQLSGRHGQVVVNALVGAGVPVLLLPTAVHEADRGLVSAAA